MNDKEPKDTIHLLDISQGISQSIFQAVRYHRINSYESINLTKSQATQLDIRDNPFSSKRVCARFRASKSIVVG